MNNGLPEGYTIYPASEGYLISYTESSGLPQNIRENGKIKAFRKIERAAEYAKQHAIKRIAEVRGDSHVWCPFCMSSVHTGDPWCEQCLTMFYVKGGKIWFDKSKESFANRKAKIEKGMIVG